MNLALTEAHRTGKTSVFNEIKKIKKEWHYIPSPARYSMPIIDFSGIEFLERYGIAFYEGMNLSLWSILDPEFNTLLKDFKKNILIDRSPIDYLSYYYLLRKPQEYIYEKLLIRMTQYYLKFIDMFILFPINIFTIPTESKTQGMEIQEDIHSILLRELENFKIDVYTLKEKTVKGRAAEIIGLLESHLPPPTHEIRFNIQKTY